MGEGVGEGEEKAEGEGERLGKSDGSQTPQAYVFLTRLGGPALLFLSACSSSLSRGCELFSRRRRTIYRRTSSERVMGDFICFVWDKEVN